MSVEQAFEEVVHQSAVEERCQRPTTDAQRWFRHEDVCTVEHEVLLCVAVEHQLAGNETIDEFLACFV